MALKDVQCPWMLGRGESGVFVAQLTNPASTDHLVRVEFKLSRSRGYPVVSQSPEKDLRIPPTEKFETDWAAAADQAGSYSVWVHLTNLDDDPQDLFTLKEIYGYCGVAVVDFLGLPAGAVALLTMTCLIVGGVFTIQQSRF